MSQSDESLRHSTLTVGESAKIYEGKKRSTHLIYFGSLDFTQQVSKTLFKTKKLRLISHKTKDKLVHSSIPGKENRAL